MGRRVREKEKQGRGRRRGKGRKRKRGEEEEEEEKGEEGKEQGGETEGNKEEWKVRRVRGRQSQRGKTVEGRRGGSNVYTRQCYMYTKCTGAESKPHALNTIIGAVKD